MNKQNTLCNIELRKNPQIIIESNVIKIALRASAVKDSMLKEPCAFEGWMFYYRSCYKGNSVQLSWDKPKYSTNSTTRNTETHHYHRFLLRVYWCQKNFPWFTIDPSLEEEVTEFISSCHDVKLSYPKSASKDKSEKETGDTINEGEAILETEIYKHLNQLVPDSADHQLPIGLFNSTISEINAITPGSKSNIDLWKIDGNKFYLYELKDDTNKSISIITELMYYANIIYCLFISKKISYPEEVFNLTQKKTFRSINLITDALTNNRIKNIEAVFLANELHPYIQNSLDLILQDINKNNSGIRFSYKKASDLSFKGSNNDK